MRITKFITGAVLALFALACSDTPTSVPESPRLDLAPSFDIVSDGQLPEGAMLLGTTGLYAQTSSTLREIDPVTGATIRDIGPVGFVVSGMEYDPTTGMLYGSTWADPVYNGLIEIDPETGVGTPIGVHEWGLADYHHVDNITVDASGQLYGWLGFYPQMLVKIDKSTGIATHVGDQFQTGIVERNGLDFDWDGNLYMVNGEKDYGRKGDVWDVDPVTGETTLVGDIAVMARHGDFHPLTNLYYGVGGDDHFLARDLLIVDLATFTVGATLPDLADAVDVVTFYVPATDDAPSQDPAKVTGAANFTVDGDRWKISVTAHRKDDGSTKGRFDVQSRDGGLRLKGNVTCLVIDGSHAWIGGVITKSHLAEWEGQAMAFSVADNGQGKKDPADQVSEMLLPDWADAPAEGIAAYACNTRPSLQLFDVGAGQIRIGN